MKLSDIWSSKERHTHMYEYHLGIANCMDYTYDVPQFIEIWKISSRLFNAVATAAAARKNHHLTIDKYPRFSSAREDREILIIQKLHFFSQILMCSLSCESLMVSNAIIICKKNVKLYVFFKCTSFVVTCYQGLKLLQFLTFGEK